MEARRVRGKGQVRAVAHDVASEEGLGALGLERLEADHDRLVARPARETEDALVAGLAQVGDHIVVDVDVTIPIVKNAAGKWYFDTVSGREEYLNRVIGRNELATILVMQVFSEAETEYATEDRDGDGVLEYAQKIRSSEGAKDGLYWPTAEGEPGSPLGEFAASARAEGYTAKGENASKSYHGYVYRVITKQGPAAVGGAKDYVVDGNMVHGFAAIAYPVNWGASGIMTFMIGPDGRVFEKNLGPKTEELATAITEFNPDKSWRQSEY